MSKDLLGQTGKLLIVFTANNNGQLLDCGCDVDSPGGLPRRLTAIKQLKGEYGELLLLEGGDFLASTDLEKQNKFVLGAYEKIKYDAIAFGEQEFWNGRDFFRKEVLGSKLLFLNSNISRDNLVKEFSDKILHGIQFIKNGFKVNVFALLHNNSFLYFPKSKMSIVTFEDVKHSLGSELNKITDHTAINIVLYHGDQWVLDELVKEFHEVSIWLSGHESTDLEPSWQSVTKPVVLPSGTDGESLELVELTQSKNGDLMFMVKRLYLTEEIVPDAELQSYLEKFSEMNEVDLIK